MWPRTDRSTTCQNYCWFAALRLKSFGAPVEPIAQGQPADPLQGSAQAVWTRPLRTGWLTCSTRLAGCRSTLTRHQLECSSFCRALTEIWQRESSNCEQVWTTLMAPTTTRLFTVPAS